MSVPSIFLPLISLLEQENRALSEGDIPGALALLPQKQILAARLAEYHAASFQASALSALEKDSLKQLSDLTTENERLVAIALEAQSHIARLLVASCDNTKQQLYGRSGCYHSGYVAGDQAFNVVSA
ncbi:hypothetical protein ABUE34_09200 [Kozakia baliensis]|uniref:hypothetical protein n=1 Tax=Kozakia baliensis TaxID=153496 RepID=UPI00345C608A